MGIRKAAVWTAISMLFEAVIVTMQVFEGREFSETPSSRSLFLFALFAFGCCAVFIARVEQITQRSQRQLYNVQVLEATHASDSDAYLPTSYSLAVHRFATRMQTIERRNDFAEAAVKGIAYLLAMSFDRALIGFIY